MILMNRISASEVNANPKDTANWPKGVWTLPPTFALGEQDNAKCGYRGGRQLRAEVPYAHAVSKGEVGPRWQVLAFKHRGSAGPVAELRPDATGDRLIVEGPRRLSRYTI
jgi:hypothetical protein